ncbi:hypothetical protein [Flavobacterium sp.]|uniref:hypothetical protein n=1 Tax=Flavobacterium sp. TaxID=239 RepID=UPI00374D7F96
MSTPFVKVLLAKNQIGIDSAIQEYETHKNYFQDCVNKVLALGVTMQENDLLLLFDNPKAYITDKLTAGETMQVGGLKLNKEKLFDLIEKPVGTNELIERIELDKQKQDFNQFTIWKANRFTITANLVSLNTESIEQIEKSFSLYITTQNQQTGLNKITELVQLINEINQLEVTQKIGMNTELQDFMSYKNNEYEVNNLAVKYFK